MRNDIYRSGELLKRELELLKQSKIPERSKQLILDFKDDLIVDGVKALRIRRYLQTMRFVNERYVDKPLDEWTEKDLKRALAKIETNGYTAQTINEFRKGLRRFFRWLHGEDWPGMKLLKGGRRDNRVPEVLTHEEIMAMIEAAKNPRDKAIIAAGYEAGLRIGELASIQWKDVVWDEIGARIKVSGKTGERVIPLVWAASYLKDWMECHPHYDMNRGEPDPDSFVFVNIGSPGYGRPMKYRMLSSVIKKAARKAGIKKRVHPHILRYSRATFAANYLTEAQMCMFFGWVQGSDMPRIYVHLSGRDIDKAVYRMYGLEVEDEEDKNSKPVKCPRCRNVNPPGARYCMRCGLILDEMERAKLQAKEAKVVDELVSRSARDPSELEKYAKVKEYLDAMVSDPKMMQFFVSKLREVVMSAERS